MSGDGPKSRAHGEAPTPSAQDPAEPSASHTHPPRRSQPRPWRAALLALIFITLASLSTLLTSVAIQLWAPLKDGVNFTADSWRWGDPSMHEPDGALMISTIAYNARAFGQSVVYHVKEQRVGSLFESDRENFDIAPGWCLRTLKLANLTRRSIIERSSKDDPTLSLNRFFSDVTIIGFGWPTVSVGGYSQRVTYIGDRVNMPSTNEADLLELPASVMSLLRTDRSKLAISPVWPGFAINTLFYATLFAIPAPLVLWLTRRRRRRLGHCTNCNYNLTGLAIDAPCPECGTLRRTNPSPTPPPTPAAPPPHP